MAADLNVLSFQTTNVPKNAACGQSTCNCGETYVICASNVVLNLMAGSLQVWVQAGRVQVLSAPLSDASL